MTVKEIVDYIKKTKQNAYDDATLLLWINELEADIQLNVLLLNAQDVVSHSALTETLVAESAHSIIYRLYLKAMIDLENGEFASYQNNFEIFKKAYNEYKSWYANKYHPADGLAEVSGYYLSAYALAVKHGFVGTEEQWVASVEAARVSAEGSANAAAASAAVAAESVTSIAESANAAETAKTAAETARTGAEAAKANIDASKNAAAQSADAAALSAADANSAKTAAESAKTVAESAKSAAETAKTDAVNAKTAAENAKTDLLAAKTAAEAARDNAAASVTAAAESASAANTAKTDAQAAKTLAETARNNAAASATAASNSASAAAGSASGANTAKSDAQAAKTAAETAATNASNSASAASLSATNSDNSASTATTKAGEASSSASAAAGSASAAATSAATASTKAAEASSSASAADLSATNAEGSASTATTKATDASTFATSAAAEATESKSYAVGGTGSRSGEDTDNAKYYKEQAQAIVGGDFATKAEVAAHRDSLLLHKVAVDCTVIGTANAEGYKNTAGGLGVFYSYENDSNAITSTVTNEYTITFTGTRPNVTVGEVVDFETLEDNPIFPGTISAVDTQTITIHCETAGITLPNSLYSLSFPTQAGASYAHVEGMYNKAFGNAAHAEGYKTKAGFCKGVMLFFPEGSTNTFEATATPNVYLMTFTADRPAATVGESMMFRLVEGASLIGTVAELTTNTITVNNVAITYTGEAN